MFAILKLRLDEVQFNTDGLWGQPDGSARSRAGLVEEVNGHLDWIGCCCFWRCFWGMHLATFERSFFGCCNEWIAYWRLVNSGDNNYNAIKTRYWNRHWLAAVVAADELQPILEIDSSNELCVGLSLYNVVINGQAKKKHSTGTKRFQYAKWKYKSLSRRMFKSFPKSG